MRCMQCGRTDFQTYAQLRTHLRSGECREDTESRNAELERSGSNEASRPFQCDLCGQRFTRAYTLRHHQQRVHTSARRTFRCPFCRDYTTDIPRDLEDHVSVAHASEPTPNDVRFTRNSVTENFTILSTRFADPLFDLESITDQAVALLSGEMRRRAWRRMSWNVTVFALLSRHEVSNLSDVVELPLRSTTRLTTASTASLFRRQFQQVRHNFEERLSQLEQLPGSSWNWLGHTRLELRCFYRPTAR